MNYLKMQTYTPDFSAMAVEIEVSDYSPLTYRSPEDAITDGWKIVSVFGHLSNVYWVFSK